MLTILGERTPTTPKEKGGGRSELLDSHGRKQTHQITGEEEDMQVLMLQSDSHLPECWQLWDIIPIPYHWGGRGGAWPALHHILAAGLYLGETARLEIPQISTKHSVCALARACH